MLMQWLAVAVVGVILGLFVVPKFLTACTHSKEKSQVRGFVEKVRQAKAAGNDAMRLELQARLDTSSSAGGVAGGKRQKQRILAIVNPHGGRKVALGVFSRVFEPLCKAIGVEVELVLTKRAKHATEIARDAVTSRRVGLIVCFSGDGMVHEVIEGVLSAASARMQVPVAVMPCGSSNGLARSFYDSVDPFDVAVKILCHGRAHSSSLVSFSTLNAAASPSFDVMGVSQAVIGDANYICEGKLRWMNMLPLGSTVKDLGTAGYLISLMRKYHVHLAMRCLPRTEDEIASGRYRDPKNTPGVKALDAPPAGASSEPGDWFELDDGWCWCETCNVSHIAQDCMPSPGLRASDGHMDLVLSHGHTRLQLLASFLRSETGTHIGDAWFEIYKVGELVYTPRDPQHDYYMSGELVGTSGKPAVARCIPDKGLFWM